MTVHHLNILKFITSSKDHHRLKFMNIKVVQDMKHHRSRNMKGMARRPHARNHQARPPPQKPPPPPKPPSRPPPLCQIGVTGVDGAVVEPPVPYMFQKKDSNGKYDMIVLNERELVCQ